MRRAKISISSIFFTKTKIIYPNNKPDHKKYLLFVLPYVKCNYRVVVN